METPSHSESFARLSLHHDNVFGDFEEFTSSKQSLPDAMFTASIKAHHPDMILTTCFSYNVDLLGFAKAGYAHAELDSVDDSLLRARYYSPASKRGVEGGLNDTTIFSKIKYTWRDQTSIIYQIDQTYYILTKPGEGETPGSYSKHADALMHACGEAQSASDKEILVFDGFWTKSKALYNEVQKASWDNVILNDEMKKTVQETIGKFFDSKETYRNLGVPWKRGLIFWGPPGNGKTVSLKALMHSLAVREDPIPSLYVKSIGCAVRDVFVKARQMAPCVLILEDIDTLISPEMRSYFFNELDGLENNDGIMLVATTNHLDHLDPGLVKRPSRFDRKYGFALPSFEERVMYCDFWRAKLQNNQSIRFPKKLGQAIADITNDFSFAYMKEAFVMTLLAIAHTADIDAYHDNYDGIEDLVLWREMQKQVKMLREDMESKEDEETDDEVPPPRLGRLRRRMRIPPPHQMPPPVRHLGPRAGFYQNRRNHYGYGSNIPTMVSFDEEMDQPDSAMQWLD